MNKLPRIYHTNANKIVGNNKKMCVVEDISNTESSEDVQKVLSKVYAGLGKYNTKVIIETHHNVYDTSLIYKGRNELITKDNVIIKVDDIKKITIKK